MAEHETERKVSDHTDYTIDDQVPQDGIFSDKPHSDSSSSAHSQPTTQAKESAWTLNPKAKVFQPFVASSSLVSQASVHPSDSVSVEKLTTMKSVTKVSYNLFPHSQTTAVFPINKGAHVPPDKNTALWIHHIPANATIQDLLGPIHGVGRVYAAHLCGRNPGRHNYEQAAKIIFFTRAAAETFHDRAQRRGPGFWVLGQRARVMWNRFRVGEHEAGEASRVLLVSGPAGFVEGLNLYHYFRRKFDFEVDRIINRFDYAGVGLGLVEFRFGSYRRQAEIAKGILETEMGDCVRSWFVEDPCE